MVDDIDTNPECSCLITNYRTKVHTIYRPHDGDIEKSCTPRQESSGVSGGTECTCKLPIPGMRDALPLNQNGSKVTLSLKMLMNMVRKNNPELISALEYLKESEIYEYFIPVFNYIMEGSVQVDRQTNAVTYIDPNIDVISSVMSRHRHYKRRRRPTSPLGQLIPLLLVAAVAALLPNIIALLVDAFTDNRALKPELLNGEEFRLEAFFKAMEFDEKQLLDRGGGGGLLTGLLGPIIAIALGAAIGAAIRAALGLRRSSLDLDQLSRNSTDYRLIAFSRAMEMTEENINNMFKDRSDDNEGGGTSAIIKMLKMQLLELFTPFLQNIIAQFSEILEARRRSNVEFDTENIRE